VHQLYLIWQQVFYAVPVNGMGVSPADFHDLVVAVRVSERGDPRSYRPGELTIPELIYVLH
jgi:hypothetical protein